jgi:hypothetical protein
LYCSSRACKDSVLQSMHVRHILKKKKQIATLQFSKNFECLLMLSNLDIFLISWSWLMSFVLPNTAQVNSLVIQKWYSL